MANELISDLPYLTITGKSGISDGVNATLELMTLTGSFGENGNLDAAFEEFTVYITAGGHVTATMSNFDISGHGYTGRLGTLDDLLPKLTCDATGYIEIIGTVSGTMKYLTGTGTGYTVPNGNCAGTFPYFSMYAKGKVSGRFGSYILRYIRP